MLNCTIIGGGMRLLYPIIFTVLLCLLTGTAVAGLDEGRAAYKNGDWAQAITELVPMAEVGDPEAQHLLGRMYDLGQGVSENLSVAIQWYEKSSNQGYAPALIDLSDAYYNGRGKEKNMDTSALLIAKAGQQHYIPAFYRVGKGSFYYYKCQ